VAKTKKAKTAAMGKKMRMIFGETKAMGSSLSRRPPAPLSGNDKEEEEEEEEGDKGEGEEKDEEEEDEEEEEEEEDDEGRKGWSD
jgi:hypothetical protein